METRRSTRSRGGRAFYRPRDVIEQMFYCQYMAGVRHVWVRPVFVPVEMPGLVLAWERTPGGWRALVTWVEASGRVVTDWCDPSTLRPAESRRQTGSRYG